MSQHSSSTVDLTSQKGVADLLKQVRVSPLPAATKTSIRELVLKYAQNGGDKGVREELEKLLQSTPLSTSVHNENNPGIQDASGDVLASKTENERFADSNTPHSTSGFAGARPIPSFAPARRLHVSSQAVPDVAPPIEQQKVVRVESVISANVEPTEELKTTPQSNDTLATPVSEANKILSVQPKALKQPAITNVPPIQFAPIINEKTAATTVVTQPVPPNYAARIQEIKHEVNALVGNPVNLIDINNAVGKQYLSALLQAMKKTTAGTREEAAASLSALETAFESVQLVLKNPTETKVVVSEFEQSAVTEPVPVINNVAVPPETLSEPVSEAQQAELAAPSVSTESESIHENFANDLTRNVQTDESDLNNSTESSNERNKIPLQQIPDHGFSVPSEPIMRSMPDTQLPVPPPRPTIQSTAVPQSDEALVETEIDVAGRVEQVQKKVHALNPETVRLETGANTTLSMVDASDTKDFLFTPAIDSGLQQLLSEWKIFKNSGLFGMGPSGADHPLYLAMKNVTMMAVTKGAFVGADTEINQSIYDYLNGWRYELGVMHQPTESFEHFLRRIVFHVLERTKS